MPEDLESLQRRVATAFDALDEAFIEADRQYPPGTYMPHATMAGVYGQLAAKTRTLYLACQAAAEHAGGK